MMMITLNEIRWILLSTLILNTYAIYLVKEAIANDFSEDAEVGHLVYHAGCSHDRCRYTLLEPSALLSHFSVEEISGSISIFNVLDRENLVKMGLCEQADCRLTLTLFDELNEEMTELVFRVLDVNDNNPVFDVKSVEIVLREDVRVGYMKRLPLATDPDYGNNSLITYYLFDAGERSGIPSRTFSYAHLFQLQQNPLSLQISGPLDFEERRQYELRLTAIDSGLPTNRFSDLDLFIRIEDVNDNAPECDQAKRIIFVRENTKVGAVIGKVQASDRDSGANALLFYKIDRVVSCMDAVDHSKTHPFKINNRTGSVWLSKPLDYESNRKFLIEVEVSDAGTQPNHVICSLEVNVEDVNDNAPEIELNFLEKFQKSKGKEVIVAENTPQETLIGHMKVRDKDSSGMNGKWRMDFRCGSVKAIPKSDGETFFLVTQLLDRELEDQYNCFVFVQDKSHPFHQTVKQFKLVVSDVNDNRPIFVLPNRVYFDEDLPTGTVILELNATDSDTGRNSKLSYSLLTASREFRLDDWGKLKTKRMFDREGSDKCFRIDVMVSDHGIPPLTSTSEIEICVNDINDNHPTFRYRSYNFSIMENEKPGTVVGRLDAVDFDSGDNGRFGFSLCSNNMAEGKSESLPFSISSNGTIKLTNFLDYERFTSYEVDVCVTDYGEPHTLSDKARVMFLVQNVNDNCPRFLIPSHMVYINRDKAPDAANWYWQFQVEDDDGDEVSVNAEVLFDLKTRVSVQPALLTTYQKQQSFRLLFKDYIPSVGFYTILLKTKDLPLIAGDLSCNNSLYLIIAVGDNSTNQTQAMAKAQKMLEKYRLIQSRERVNVNGTKSYFIAYLILSFLMFLTITIAYCFKWRILQCLKKLTATNSIIGSDDDNQGKKQGSGNAHFSVTTVAQLTENLDQSDGGNGNSTVKKPITGEGGSKQLLSAKYAATLSPIFRKRTSSKQKVTVYNSKRKCDTYRDSGYDSAGLKRIINEYSDYRKSQYYQYQPRIWTPNDIEKRRNSCLSPSQASFQWNGAAIAEQEEITL